jgi:hypothetical protein
MMWRQLRIGHCLRYWSHYVQADALIRSGDYGRFYVRGRWRVLSESRCHARHDRPL